MRNSGSRETDSPTPPPYVDNQHHNGSGIEGGESKNKHLLNSENCRPIKTEGISTR